MFKAAAKRFMKIRQVVLPNVFFPLLNVQVFKKAIKPLQKSLSTSFNARLGFPIYNRYKLDYLQLHGNESPELCRELREKGYRIIKAISVSSEEDIRKTESYESAVDYFLFDTRCTGYGGSGQTFDWSILKHYEGQTPFLLSGGIRLELLPQLLRFSHPQLIGFDLNSGFESAPGLKDAKRIQSFINQLKQTNV